MRGSDAFVETLGVLYLGVALVVMVIGVAGVAGVAAVSQGAADFVPGAGYSYGDDSD